MRPRYFAKFLPAMLALICSAPVPAAAQAQRAAIRTPAPGSAERAAMLNLIRPHAEKDFGAPVEFVVRALNVSGDHAVALLDAQRPGGGTIDVERTPAAAAQRRAGAGEAMIDCCHVEAILQRVKGRWTVVEAAAGSTDVWYESWCRRLPFGMCMANGGKP